MDFDSLNNLVKGWIVSNIVVHDNVSELIHEFIGGIVGFHKYENSTDKALLIKTDSETFVGFQGTKNYKAWLYNLMFWGRNGFHYGISKSTEKIFSQIVESIPHNKPVMISGHSRGASMALYANLMLRRIGAYEYVESIGFSGPYIAIKGSGLKELKRLSVVHTNIETDASGPLHSDPVDDVGALRGKHYGKTIVLDGSGGVFDHSYKSITKNLLLYFNQINHFGKYENEISALLKTLERLAIK